MMPESCDALRDVSGIAVNLPLPAQADHPHACLSITTACAGAYERYRHIRQKTLRMTGLQVACVAFAALPYGHASDRHGSGPNASLHWARLLGSLHYPKRQALPASATCTAGQSAITLSGVIGVLRMRLPVA
ncbi:hypothetical protein, partial [Xanthomonas perforans]|uniref:hypothetical protein n=1 Tax=Xanthomonas perforans TaxID=442694 RepID=UPI001CC2CB7E